MKYLKLFEDYTCKYESDQIRLDMMKEALERIEEDDFEDMTEKVIYEDLVDPSEFDGYPDQTYIQYEPDENEITLWEGWSQLCWDGLYSKEEYEGLEEREALKKLIKERLIPSMETLGLKYIDYEIMFYEAIYNEDGYIMRVSFKIK